MGGALTFVTRPKVQESSALCAPRCGPAALLWSTRGKPPLPTASEDLVRQKRQTNEG